MLPVVALALSFILAAGPDSLVGMGGGKRTAIEVVSPERTVPFTDLWAIQGQVKVIVGRDTLPALPDDSLHLIRIPTTFPASPGDSITLIWRSASIAPSNEFTYFTPYQPTPDTLHAPAYARQSSSLSNPLDSWSGLRRSGSITRGIRFGEAGNNSTSGLHLELSGRPSPGVGVDAVVDDRSLPANSEGGSATLGELDKLLIKVTTPHLQGTLGDWDLDWQSGKYGTIERRLKGGEVSAESGNFQADMVAAGSGGRFKTALLSGRAGDQGPYELTDRYGGVGPAIVSGSEKVRLDGRLLRRGVEADYLLDYETGGITFNPTVPIQEGSRIELEYEYSEEAYAGSFYAARSGGSVGNWNIEAMAAQEGLNPDQPLSFDWTPAFRTTVANAGNDTSGAAVSGIDSVGPGKGDYIWTSALDSSRVLVFSHPDSLGKPTGYLQADFTTDPSGGYERLYDSSLQTFYYQWVGAGQGGYSPVRRLPLPDRARLAQVRASYSADGFSSDFEVAGSDYDPNLLSTVGDKNSSAGALAWKGGWTRPDSSLNATISLRRQEAAFHPLSRPQDVDYGYHWGLQTGTPAGTESALEAQIGAKPVPQLRLSADVGRLLQGTHLDSRRLGLNGNWTDDLQSGNLQLETISSISDSTFWNNRADRIAGSYELLKGFLRPSARVRAERNRLDRKGWIPSGNQFYETEPGVEVHPADWTKVKLGLLYRHDDALSGDYYMVLSDLYTWKLGWEGRRPGVDWSASGIRTLETYGNSGSNKTRSTSALWNLDAGASGAPLHFRGNYSLTTGNGRTDAWVATYVGAGRGGYRREGDRYVPDPNGDFNLQAVPTDTVRFTTRVDFSGRLDWKATPSKDTTFSRYPFGISGTTTNFEAAVTTYDPDPLRAFLLERSAFRTAGVANSRWNWRQDVNFLEGERAGDGRLTLQRNETRDAGLSGGEAELVESAALRVRLGLTPRSNLYVEPQIQRDQRWGIRESEARSSVKSVGSDVELRLPGPLTNAETSLRGGLERRRESVYGGLVTERRLQPSVMFRIGNGGSLRVEGEWRRLDASGSHIDYDLTQSWSVGENYASSVTLDYRLGKNLTASALFRSRWQGKQAPIQSGLVEMTASL